MAVRVFAEVRCKFFEKKKLRVVWVGKICEKVEDRMRGGLGKWFENKMIRTKKT